MSYPTGPDDANWDAINTTPPIVEQVVREPEPIAASPEHTNLRWLWWLLGLLALAGLIWAIARSYRTEQQPAVTPTPTGQAVAGSTLALQCGSHEVLLTFGTTGDAIEARINNEVDIIAIDAMAASGVKYEGNISVVDATANTPAGPVSFWNHGADWLFTIGNEDIECVPQ